MINNVQALRALAAYAVVIFHCKVLLLGSVTDHSGSWGVDIFFVISGFVMAYTTNTFVNDPWGFLSRRVSRIVPLYWLMTIAVFLASMLLPSLFKSSDVQFIDLVKSLLFIPLRKYEGLVQPVLFLGWSLNYEMMFYVVFATSLCIRGSGARTLAITVAFTAFVIAGAVFRPENVILQFYTDPIILEFVAGAWIGVAARSGRLVPKQAAPLLLCIATGSLAILISTDFIWPDVPKVVAWGIPSVLIVSSAVSLEIAGYKVTRRLILTQGAASYSLYLTHFFSYEIFTKIVFHLIEPAGLAIRGAAFLASIIGAGVTAYLVWRFIEQPSNRFARNLIDSAANEATVGVSSLTP